VSAAVPLRLRDGTTLLARALEARDRAALAAGVARLSPDSRHLRFGTPKPRLRPVELDRLLDLDHHEREALVAYDPVSGRGLAVARYAGFPGEPGVAELALTVADEWQGRGLGPALLELLRERAAEEGIRRLRASAIGDNRRAVKVARRAGATVVSAGGGLVELELPVAGRTA
jgi:RimJ/RimL family protein N-acetyltransferase